LKAVGSGTLFLDEIGELTPQMQTKLLRALQEMEISPVGSTSSEKIHARFIAATNRDLVKAVEREEFRRDLFYRLNVVFLEIPPLRERPDDIEILARHFIGKFNTESRHIDRIDPRTLDILKKYPWPGNVRELENCIERALALGSSSTLMPADLPDSIAQSRSTVADTVLPRSLDEYEKEAIMRTLAFTNGNKRQAARILGIGKSALYAKLEKYHLNP
jgi:transcriptional regulator with PAS, ATPase and Fis domain